jgi:predicted neuraminidase
MIPTTELAPPASTMGVVDMKINIMPAMWEAKPNSVAALRKALDDGKEFTVCDIRSQWGTTTTKNELLEQGFTSAQVRYGKHNEKVWTGNL